MDSSDFDPNETDDEGLPLVYNEEKIAEFWGDRPGELFTRWTRFTAISGASGIIGDVASTLFLTLLPCAP